MTDITLGIDLKTKQTVTIASRDRTTSAYGIGTTGCGKSTLLQTMIVADIESREKKNAPGTALIEPHQDVTHDVLRNIKPERLDDVVHVDLTRDHLPGINIYECPDLTDPRMVSYTLNQVMDIFEKLYDMSRSTPRMAMVMRHVTLTMMFNPGMTLLEVPLLLSFKRNNPFRARLAQNALPAQQQFWEEYEEMTRSEKQDLVDSTRNKVDEFINDPIARSIFGQSKTTINFRTLMDTHYKSPGKIVLIKLDTGYPLVSSLLGSIVVGQILVAAFSRKDLPEDHRRPFHVYVDEFQNFATPAMNKLMTEASRKYKVPIHAFHQSREQEGMNDTIRATTKQVGTIFTFRTSAEDARVMAPEYNIDPAEQLGYTIPSDILYHLTRHESDTVKDFELTIVRPMLEAKALQIEKEQDVRQPTRYGIVDTMADPIHVTEKILPKYDFGEGEVEFYPNELRRILHELEVAIYKMMRHEDNRRGTIIEFLISGRCLFRLDDEWSGRKEDISMAIVRAARKLEAIFKPTDPMDYDVLLSDPEVVAHPQYERFMRLYNKFLAVFTELWLHPIYVPVSTRTKTEESLTDRQVRALTHLPVGHAWVKMNKTIYEKGQPPRRVVVEHQIETIVPDTGKSSPDAQKRLADNIKYVYEHNIQQGILVHREEVERQIQARQNILPEPTTRQSRTR